MSNFDKMSELENMTNAIVKKTPLEVQAEKVKSLLLRDNIFITGGAGVGKSYLTRAIVSVFRNPIVLASTGMAANNIKGSTVHSIFKLGISNTIKELKAYDNYRKKQMMSRGYSVSKADYYLFKNLVDLLSVADVIIIDEISMISSNTLDLIAYRLEQLTERRIPILVVGDFYQLPPVKGRYAFNSPNWNFKNIQLDKILRTDNVKFAEIQADVRTGHKTSEVVNYIKNLTVKPDGEPIKLFSLNKDVDRANQAHLKSIDGKGYKVTTNYTLKNTKLPKSVLEQFKKELKIDDVFRFKIGARVISIVNFEDLYNGMLATITDVNPSSGEIIITSDAGQKIPVSKYTFQKMEVTESGGRVTMEVIAEAVQFPLLIAAASTIHKAQGMSISNLYVDCNKIFERGQFYVALSRATNPTKLVVDGFSPKHIKKNPEVDKFYEQAEKVSL